LLMRFYDPVRGTVRVDGTDLRKVDQTVLRRSIAIVLQEPILFNDTVRNNIAYGRPDASAGDIIAAARGANAHDFVMQLPAGYDTLVGERGGRLSVGERQRITIARALLKNAPMIILDEASSSLDSDSEALVQQALERLAHGRTTFVIAHRLATVVNANRIVLLQDGRIAECGTHAQLMRAGGHYTSLVRRQMSGLIGSSESHESAAEAAA
jgi:ATP-binding cassette, subfamily B, bacterial